MSLPPLPESAIVIGAQAADWRAAVTLAGLSPQLGQLLTIAVTTIFSYLGHKYFTFKTPLEVGEVPPRELVEKQ